MTQSVTFDVFLKNKLARQKDELSRRVKEGTLDIEEVSAALQLLIENRFFVHVEPDVLSKVELENLKLRRGAEVSVSVEEESTPAGDPQKFSLAIRLAKPTPNDLVGKTFYLPLEGLIDGFTTPRCLALAGKSLGDPYLALRCALNKMGRVTIEWDPPSEEPNVSFTLFLPNGIAFVGACKLDEVSYYLEATKNGKW